MQPLIHYQSFGEGIPVMLVHGFGEDSSIWQSQIEALQQDCFLLVPDLRGSGKTPLGNEPLSVESMARDLLEILNAENVQQCILLGHSMGGYISLAFAEMFPERLAGLGLIHSTAFADSDEKKETRRKAIDFIREHGAYAFLKTSIPNLFADAFREKHSEAVIQLMEKAATFSPDALIAYYEAMMNRSDRSVVLKNTKIPVLMFIGEQDRAVPSADALQQCSMPAVCQVELLPEAGHMGMLEVPEKLSSSIRNFIRIVSSSNTPIA